MRWVTMNHISHNTNYVSKSSMRWVTLKKQESN